MPALTVAVAYEDDVVRCLRELVVRSACAFYYESDGALNGSTWLVWLSVLACDCVIVFFLVSEEVRLLLNNTFAVVVFAS